MFRTPISPRVKPTRARMKSFPAATSGWIANQNRAITSERLPTGQVVRGAAVLENWFPTATGVRMRGGNQKHATIGNGSASVTALFTYRSGNAAFLYGATATGVYDVTSPSDPDVSPSPVIFAAGGDWSAAQFATAGGVFLVAVNGEDPAWRFDGTSWTPTFTAASRQIAYDGGTAAFTVGETLTGGTSTATGTIASVQGDTTSGTLWLTGVSGTFQDDEAITSAAGAAVADGADADGSSVAFTGIAGSDLNYVWTFKNRLFFVEKASLSAWYLSVDSVGGTIAEFPLAGVFGLGGTLLFGATISADSGDGMDDRCVFITSEGQVAVYQGTNPASAADWALVGVYRIGRPLGKNAWMRAGGDLVIATDVGLVSIMQAMQTDFAALGAGAVSRNIETAWDTYVSTRSLLPWHVEVWPTQQMAIVVPNQPSGEATEIAVVNVRTGAWCNFTGWDMRCIRLFGDRLFFGSTEGRVYECEVTGADDGLPYTATYIPLFDDCKTPASRKVGMMARAVVLAPRVLGDKLRLAFDFDDDPTGAVPSDTPIDSLTTWGTAVWGASVWGAIRPRNTYQTFRSVGGSGYRMAPVYQVTSGAIDVPDVELVAIDVTYETGDITT
jgi:hypothetical protein